MKKRVFFLGAGATKAVYPNMPGLEDLLWQMLNSSSYDSNLIKVRVFVSKYFFDLNDKSKEQYPRIQDVLSFIDTALLTETGFEIDKQYLQDIQRNIISLMGHAILGGMDIPQSAAISKFTGMIEYSIADVITTNYDISLDNWFIKNATMNYGIKFRESIDIANPLSKSRIRSDQFGSKLLKLHGSFNWLYCPRCDELDVAFRQKEAALECWKNKIYCYNKASSCTSPYEPLIVAPTFLKNYKNRIIREVWSLAEQSVAEAAEIVFIGYSMPPDDYEIKSMLLRGISRNKNKPFPITVIGQNPQGDETKEEVNRDQKLNYERVFGRVIYRPVGFGQYVEEL